MVLTITPQAMDVLRRVTAHPTMEPAPGLRIAHQERSGAVLQVRSVQGPQPGDEVVERDGARLYLEPGAARRVRGRSLDATVDDEGRVQFVLRAAA